MSTDATDQAPETSGPRPNVLSIVADDLGFSDLGSYRGEIRAPALDRLARKGVRLSQFYASARCAPVSGPAPPPPWYPQALNDCQKVEAAHI